LMLLMVFEEGESVNIFWAILLKTGAATSAP
jgi:hypothetical protein